MPYSAIEQKLRALSRTLAPESAKYLERHEPRYRYLAELITSLAGQHTFARVLDVGMSYETVLLGHLLPAARIDCFGTGEDYRFSPQRAFSFLAGDLNDVAKGALPAVAEADRYDLVVFMEVLEHLYTPPEMVLGYLAGLLRPGGLVIVSTPNAAWVKNRLALLRGRNPFELLKADRQNMGHIREYTKAELQTALTAAGLREVRFERRGLYQFKNRKDNVISRVADLVHSSLSRTLVAVGQKPAREDDP